MLKLWCGWSDCWSCTSGIRHKTLSMNIPHTWAVSTLAYQTRLSLILQEYERWAQLNRLALSQVSMVMWQSCDGLWSHVMSTPTQHVPASFRIGLQQQQFLHIPSIEQAFFGPLPNFSPYKECTNINGFWILFIVNRLKCYQVVFKVRCNVTISVMPHYPPNMGRWQAL